MKLDADEKALLDSVEGGEWKSAAGGKRERARYSRYTEATFRTELASDLRRFEVLALEGERRPPRDDAQPREARQSVDETLGDSVGQVLVPRVARRVLRAELAGFTPLRCPGASRRRPSSLLPRGSIRSRKSWAGATGLVALAHRAGHGRPARDRQCLTPESTCVERIPV